MAADCAILANGAILRIIIFFYLTIIFNPLKYSRLAAFEIIFFISKD